MKIKIQILITIVVIIVSGAVKMSSQVFYGTTMAGGQGHGTFYKTDGTVGSHTILNVFTTTAVGDTPDITGDLLLASNGKIYGLSSGAGTFSTGTLFEYDTVSNTAVKKFDFTTSTGHSPRGGLIEATNGKIYGTTTSGGANGYGTLFEYDFLQDIFTKKYDFSNATGGHSGYGKLCEASNGKLYGVTPSGGSSGCGTLYEYDITNTTFSVLAHFTSSIGCSPYGSVTQATNGSLYGLASTGGTNNSSGTIFEYDIANNVLSKQLDLGGIRGKEPMGSFVLAPNGKLYATTNGTSACVIEFNPSFAQCYTVSALTSSIENRSTPCLIGTNSLIVCYPNNSSFPTFKHIYFSNNSGFSTIGTYLTFSVVLGQYKNGTGGCGLISTNGGKLYGVTDGGGNGGMGAIFYFRSNTPSNNAYVKRMDFGCTSGKEPSQDLYYADNGLIYGVTESGGSHNYGTIYEFNPFTEILRTVFHFTGPNMAYPKSGLMKGYDDDVYGNTFGANTASIGSVYKFSPLGGGASAMFSTTTTALGTNIGKAAYNATLNAQHFGITGDYGSFVGRIYGHLPVHPSSGNVVTYQYLHAFGSSQQNLHQGRDPIGNVVAGPDDFFYGVCRSGGQMPNAANPDNSGLIFKFYYLSQLVGITYSTAIASFQSAGLGFRPSGSPILVNGNLYGLTEGGGTFHPNGTLYAFNISTGTGSLLSSFSGVPTGPIGNLLYASNGKFYGHTSTSGTYSMGTLFEYNPSTNSITTIHHFTGAQGGHGFNIGSSLLEVPCAKPVLNASILGTTGCAGQNHTFVTSDIAYGENAYVWKLPAGWSGTANSNSLVIQNPNNYTIIPVSVTATNSCGSTSVGISYTVYPNPTITVISASACAGNMATLQAQGASGYKFEHAGGLLTPTNVGFGWTNARHNPSVTTIYTVTGISNGCWSAPISATISVINTPTVTLTLSSTTVCAGGQLTLTVSGASNYSLYANSQLFAVGAFTSQVRTPTVNTTYDLIGSVPPGCYSNFEWQSVTVSANPTITVNSGSVCYGGAFTFTATGANNYTFTGGSPLTSNTTAIVSPTATAIYTIAGTNSLNCPSSQKTATVTVIAQPTIGSSGNYSVCAGSSVQVSFTGANTYTTFLPTGSSLTTMPFVVSPTITSDYTVTGKSTAGCVSLPTVKTVTAFALPVMSLPSGTSCSGKSFTLNASGAPTFTYLNGGPVVFPLATTVYSVRGTSSDNCLSPVTTATIVVFANPTITVNSGTICNGSTFTILASGAGQYSYTGGSQIVSPSATTSYSVTGTSTAGCISTNTAVSNVTVHAVPVISVNSGTVCAGQNFTIQPSGAGTYFYSTGTSVFAPVTSTFFTVSGTSSVGCASSNTATGNVTVFITPTVSVNSGSICSGQVFTLSGSGASTYIYQGGSSTVSPLSSTSYTVRGVSANGCISANLATADVTVHTTPTITVNSGSICTGQTFTINPSGAGSYQISGGTAFVSPNTSQSYTITGSTNAGCVSNQVISNVTVYITPTISVNSGTICSGQPFVMNPSGASSYNFSGGSATVYPIVNTTYTVTGISANGCLAASAALSQVSVNISPTVSVNSGSICAGQSFTMTPSGALNYSYTGGGPIVNPTTNTFYLITGSSVDGCQSVNTATATVSVLPLPVIGVNSGSICAGLSFTISPTGGVSYTFSSGSSVVKPAQTSSYSVIGSDVNGCVGNTAISNVVVNSIPVLTITSTNPFICEGETVTLTVSGATNYLWANGGNLNMIIVSPTVSTGYNVGGTDDNGCVGFATFPQMVSPCTGISGSEPTSGTRIYPNPNFGEFTVETDAVTDVTITNELGQLILHQQVREGTSRLEMKGHAKGLYFVILQKGQNVQTLKMVVE